MPNKPQYLDFLRDQLSPLAAITFRAMFGGHTVYGDGVPFGLVADNTLYLKVDDQNRAAFTDRGLGAFRPFADQDATMSYYPAPPELFESPDGLTEWAAPALEAGRRAQARRKPRSRKQPA